MKLSTQQAAAAIRKWLPARPRLRGKLTFLVLDLGGGFGNRVPYDTEWTGNVCRRRLLREGRA